MGRKLRLGAAVIGLAIAGQATAEAAAPAPVYDERPAKLEQPAALRDYERRSVDIPMRDGIN
ncbi:hypothetical protein, partial [Shewanella algae]|uniref:hypothetical protein n=1 Tax=Shewanella algae TaxID=38313 RepID=UPI00313E1CC5